MHNGWLVIFAREIAPEYLIYNIRYNPPRDCITRKQQHKIKDTGSKQTAQLVAATLISQQIISADNYQQQSQPVQQSSSKQ